jgi:hypothetical protein
VNARAEPMSPRGELWSPWVPVAWTAVSLGFFVASAFAIFVVNMLVRLFINVPHLVAMAEWSLVWGGLSTLGVVVAGRLAFGRVPRVSATAIILASIGIVLSAIVHVVLQQWAVARFGFYDPEFVWWTAGLFAVLIGLATSAFGVFVAPPGAANWPLAFALAGAAAVAFIVLGNLPGLRDGIESGSWPLAIWLGISGLYAAVIALASVVRARHLGATPER